MAYQSFSLDKANAKLLGVCAGLNRITGIDVLWIRVAAVLATLLGSGLPLLIYIVIALLAPACSQTITR